MHLVPIPTTPAYLNASFELWSPFLPQLAQRSPWSVEQLLGQISRHEVQPVLAFEGDMPVVLIGLSIAEDNDERVGELIYCTFKREYPYRAVRGALLAELESYLRDHVKCKKCRPICPPGWRKFLEAHGYQLIRVDADKHIAMEKVL